MMSLQYISDSNGETTGVFITLNDWKKLKEKYKNLENELSTDWYDELSFEQKNDIEKGLEDIKNGNVHSDNDVRESVRQRILNA